MVATLLPAMCGVVPQTPLTPRRATPSSWIVVPQETALPQPTRHAALWLRLRRLFAAEAEETLSNLMLVPDAESVPADYCDFSRLRDELEAAGFQPFTERDLQLSRALNVGYLLRLSIEPSLSTANASLAEDVYGSQLINGTLILDANASLPFDGRMLLFHRGYGTENTRGRLLLPKLDYLQARPSSAPLCLMLRPAPPLPPHVVSAAAHRVHASGARAPPPQAAIVQRSVGKVTTAVGRVERAVSDRLTLWVRQCQRVGRRGSRRAREWATQGVRSGLPVPSPPSPPRAPAPPRISRRRRSAASRSSIARGRYGSAFEERDVLKPFLYNSTDAAPMEGEAFGLIERVSIRDVLVDPIRSRLRDLAPQLFSVDQLVEPSYGAPPPPPTPKRARARTRTRVHSTRTHEREM